MQGCYDNCSNDNGGNGGRNCFRDCGAQNRHMHLMYGNVPGHVSRVLRCRDRSIMSLPSCLMRGLDGGSWNLRRSRGLSSRRWPWNSPCR